MRSPKFLILAAIAIAVAGGALALIVVRELNVVRQEERIAKLAMDLTGRQVEARGGLRIGFSLPPRLVAKDVRIGNASWGSRPTMLTAERVDISVALVPLLFGVVDLTDVTLSGVSVLLETDAAGRSNWDLGDGLEDRGGGWFHAQVFAEHVLVEDFVLETRGPRSQDATHIAVTRLELAADSASEPVSLDLSAGPAGAEFLASGSIGSLADWLSGGAIPLQLDFRLENSRFTTDATLVLGGRPRLRGHVRSGTIDLEAWLSDPRERREATGSTAAKGRLFPTAPLGLAALGSSSADVSIAVGDVVDQEVRFELTHAELALEGGVLRLDPVRAVFGAAHVEASLEIDTRAEVPGVRFSLTGRALDLGDLLERLELTDQVEAIVDVGVKASGRGDSVAAILGSLDGHVALAVRRGEIPTRYVDRFVSDLSSLVMPWARPPKRVEIGCAVAEFAIEQGVARSQALMFDTRLLTLRGRGEIDLGNETLNLDLSPRPRNRDLLTLATDLTLQGPLASPRARASAVGMVNTVRRFALGPARLLAPVGSVTANRQRECAERVQAIEAGARGAS